MDDACAPKIITLFQRVKSKNKNQTRQILQPDAI